MPHNTRNQDPTKEYVVGYFDELDTKCHEYEFFADTKQLANEHAAKLCRDNGWRLSYVIKQSHIKSES